MQDKFSAVWVSHSSIGDYLKCPRAYYLNNVYKDPRTGHKINLMQPPLALGQVVHQVIESLSTLPVEKRLKESLLEKYEAAWEKVTGKMGGFKNDREETEYKRRGASMIKRVVDNPGILLNKAVKMKQDLPNFYLSETDNIILCGKIDWLEYIPDDDSVHIVDFKTGKRQEDTESLQLPIYHLLVANCQKRPVSKASYWYLNRDDEPQAVNLPQLDKAREKVLKIAKKIKLARQLGHFRCPHNGCFACEPLEAILKGEAELVGISDYNQDLYIL